MEQQERQALVHYISKRLKYIYLYVNKDEVESVMERLSNFHFVRKVEPSLRKEIRMDFTHILPELREEIEKEKAEQKASERL